MALKAMFETERELAGQMEGMGFHRRIPEKGWGGNRVIDEINKMMQLGRIQRKFDIVKQKVTFYSIENC